MSDEQRNEETEVEGHASKVTGSKYLANDEPGDEVEGHASKVTGSKYLANDEPGDEAEVEGHASKVNRPGIR